MLLTTTFIGVVDVNKSIGEQKSGRRKTMYWPLELGLSSFLIVLGGGFAGLIIIMFIYKFNQKWDDYLYQQMRKRQDQDLQDNLNAYAVEEDGERVIYEE